MVLWSRRDICIIMTTTATICENCKKEFLKNSCELRRSKKLNRPIFCSRFCSTSHRNKTMTKKQWAKISSNIEFKKRAGNRQDEFSPFRAYINQGRASNQKHKMSLTPQCLRKIWEKQNGICPYTGIKMILPRNTLDHTKIRSLKKASLDRIDSSKEYTEENIEFVCMAINIAKNNFKKEEMKSFIQEIISSSK